MKPRIDGSSFGSITVDGLKIKNDIILRLDGSVVKRKKQLSKRIYATSHVISKPEATHVYDKGADLLIIGTGRFDSVRLSQEAEAYLKKRECRTLLAPTHEAIGMWNEAEGLVIGLFHVTC